MTSDGDEILGRARVMREAWDTMGPIAVKRWADPSAATEFAVAEGSWEAEGPVTVHARAGTGAPFPPEPDRQRALARYDGWREAAADGWRAD